MILLDGKAVSQKILKNLKSQIDRYIDIGSRVPRLDIIIVGDDYASKKYVSMKEKRASELILRLMKKK